MFKDLENSESKVSHFPEMQKVKVRWLCLKSASCAHREWPLLENVGLDVCVKPAAPSVDLDTGSLTV